MGVCVDAAPRPGSSGADSERGAGAGPGAAGAVARLACVGPQQDLVLGRDPFPARPPGGVRADVVSRRWIDTLDRSRRPRPRTVLFDRALRFITPERVELRTGTEPILLACSDNGPQMTSKATREFFAALAVAQRLGRPRTPTDQAWIEIGHVENPQLPRPGRPRNRAATRPPRLQHHPPPRRHRICHPQRRAHRPRNRSAKSASRA